MYLIKSISAVTNNNSSSCLNQWINKGFLEDSLQEGMEIINVAIFKVPNALILACMIINALQSMVSTPLRS